MPKRAVQCNLQKRKAIKN